MAPVDLAVVLAVVLTVDSWRREPRFSARSRSRARWAIPAVLLVVGVGFVLLTPWIFAAPGAEIASDVGFRRFLALVLLGVPAPAGLVDLTLRWALRK